MFMDGKRRAYAEAGSTDIFPGNSRMEDRVLVSRW
jgi:hypothetical protein